MCPFLAGSSVLGTANFRVLVSRMTQPEWLIQNPTDDSLLVLVPGGPFLAGGPLRHESGVDLFPATLRPYYLGVVPVTNAQFKRFVDATGHPPPSGPARATDAERSWEGRMFKEGRARHPVTGVSWEDARKYAEWAGLRLPTEIEWEKGARGPGGRAFPWGDDWRPDLCRNEENRKQETTCEVWDHPEGCSIWGCYQMSGNAWEWCEDWFDPHAYRRYARGDLSLPITGTRRVVRGGSWFNVGPDSFLCTYRFHASPDEREWQYGFRLARDVET